MIATAPSVITAEDVARAERAAEIVEWEVAAAWETVEQETRTALALEARAEHARAQARRLRVQIGFRRVSL